MEHARNQKMVTVGWIDDLSSRNVESSGEMENGVGGCIGRAHHVAPSPPIAIVAAIVTSDTT